MLIDNLRERNIKLNFTHWENSQWNWDLLFFFSFLFVGILLSHFSGKHIQKNESFSKGHNLLQTLLYNIYLQHMRKALCQTPENADARNVKEKGLSSTSPREWGSQYPWEGGNTLQPGSISVPLPPPHFCHNLWLDCLSWKAKMMITKLLLWSWRCWISLLDLVDLE